MTKNGCSFSLFTFIYPYTLHSLSSVSQNLVAVCHFDTNSVEICHHDYSKARWGDVKKKRLKQATELLEIAILWPIGLNALLLEFA